MLWATKETVTAKLSPSINKSLSKTTAKHNDKKP